MDGIIVINKEKRYTSNDVVQIAKKTFHEKVGHCGTLDPMATGVLPLLIGKGTLCSKYLVNHDKIYTATIKLGIKTDTADSEGKIIKTEKVEDIILNKNYIIDILETFKGKQIQIPPLYSAIKIKGKKLYEYARNGQDVKIEPRNIEIYDVKLQNINKIDKEITYKVSCSKGTYIRSLCEDIAKKLGTIGYMKELNREKVGDFDILDAIQIEDLKANITNEKYLEKYFISVEELFNKNKNLFLNQKHLKMFLNGVKIFNTNEDGVYKIYDENQLFIGIGVIDKYLLKRDIII